MSSIYGGKTLTGSAAGSGGGGGGVSGLSTADGGTAIADNVVIRGDGTEGIQGSAVQIGDASGSVTISTTSNLQMNLGTNGSGSWAVQTDGGFMPASGTRRAGLSGANGTTTAPGLTFVGDLDTGVSGSAADQMSLIAGGQEIQRIDTSHVTAFKPLKAKRPVVNESTSTPLALSADDSGTIYTNNGATGIVTFNLPSAAAGITYTFATSEALRINVVAASGDQIVHSGQTADDSIRSGNAEGASITLVAIDATSWVVTAAMGSWTVFGS